MSKVLSDLFSALKFTLQKRIPSAVIESVTSNPSMNGDDTMYIFRVKGCSPVMIRSSKLQDVMGEKGPPGAMNYIIEKICDAKK